MNGQKEAQGMANRQSLGSSYHPTLAMAQDRARTLHLEASDARLAARVRPSDRPTIRVRVGQALIDLGSALAMPAESHQPSLTD